MKEYFSFVLSTYTHQLTFFLLLATLSTSACVSTSGSGRADQLTAGGDRRSVADIIPGVPNRPELVTVVPFYWKPDETDREKTKVVIPAEIDGYHSIFIVDIGCPPFMLNRTFLQPSLTGGVDSVTDANRMPDHSHENVLESFDKVHVKNVQIGTFNIAVVDTTIGGANNAYLGHEWGNFSWVFSPRLGNIGLSVLSQFETIIDYPHQRLILIRVDSAGHRLVDVPAYTPKWSAPLVEIDRWNNTWRAWGVAVRSDHSLDTLNTANNTNIVMMDTGAPDDGDETLGYPFLSQLRVVGFNHRTHQFLLYR